MSKKILIFGIGPLSKTLYSFILNDNLLDLIGFIVDDEFFVESNFLDLPVYKLSVAPKDYDLLMCIGYKNMRKRALKFRQLEKLGFNFTNYIHNTVTISPNVKIGVNNIIFPNVIIEPNVSIKNNNIIWSQSLIGHDAVVGSDNYISAKVLVGGNVKLNNGCFLGNGCAMINDLIIEYETYLVASSFLFNNTIQFGKYFGTPARKISMHQEKGITI